MSEKKEEEKIKFCDVKEVNETMNEAYKFSKSVPFNPNSYVYLNDIYNIFNEKIQNDPDFLKYVECELSNKLFKEILTSSNKYNIKENIKIQEIQPNDILLIQCPSIFAPYHFINAVVNEAKSSVSIFQSFGSSMRLHKIEMDYDTFKNYLLSLNMYKNEGRTFIDDYKMLLPIEDDLYGINIPDYIAINEAQFNKKEEEDEDDEDEEEDEEEKKEKIRIIQKSQEIGLSPRYYENLEYTHTINMYRLNITAYRVKPPNGGKRKRKSKTVKLRKKSKKRTRRYKYLK